VNFVRDCDAETQDLRLAEVVRMVVWVAEILPELDVC
jgi:hypothetical protein